MLLKWRAANKAERSSKVVLFERGKSIGTFNQVAFTCLKSTMDTLEEYLKSIQS